MNFQIYNVLVDIYNSNIKFDNFIDKYYEKYIDFYSSAKKVLKKIS